MIEISIFGALLATLASAASVVFVVTALLAIAFLAVTGLSALATGSERRRLGWLGGVVSVLVFSLSLAGLRVGGLLGTVVVSAALAAATGALAACFAPFGSRALAALGSAHEGRLAALRSAELSDAKRREEGRLRFLDGADLRDEVAEADAALDRLRAALQALGAVQLDLTDKLAAAGESPAGRDFIRLRDEVAIRIDLGARILTAAEIAVFRLACFEPLRRLLRRRPQEATVGLSRAATATELEARIDRGVEDIKAFLGEVDDTRKSLVALEARRPSLPALDKSDAPDAPNAPDAVGHDGPDPLERARAELDAMESAYRAVLERAHVVRLRLATRAGMEQVASAAGAVSESARTMGLDEGDLRLLLQEVARAESAMTISAPDGADIHALTDALARSADALAQKETASLDELLKAMREMA